ncbi:hypothetical protein KLI54_17865 [Bacillus thuringiensis]|uniref:hypothetical protein n=1 Tax=Bacillus thuringiensis TaxID=1428 RepID=UPI001398AC0A|nr:hypothetical protein [Bacillus thuringiensis]MBT2200135.1 hypothetical protein [Bacillus thuringiensis]BCA35682.1 hypothetical protein BwiPL1_40640 [Bacillus wiedmannii]
MRKPLLLSDGVHCLVSENEYKMIKDKLNSGEFKAGDVIKIQKNGRYEFSINNFTFYKTKNVEKVLEEKINVSKIVYLVLFEELYFFSMVVCLEKN